MALWADNGVHKRSTNIGISLGLHDCAVLNSCVNGVLCVASNWTFAAIVLPVQLEIKCNYV